MDPHPPKTVTHEEWYNNEKRNENHEENFQDLMLEFHIDNTVCSLRLRKK
jgi:hypothetical protein